MKKIVFLILSLSSFSCIHKRVLIESTASGGLYIAPISDSLKSQVRIMNFHKTTCVIFPAKYATRRFGKDFGENVVFFDPDTTLIKKIPQVIIDQFCIINQESERRIWTKRVSKTQLDSTKSRLNGKLEDLIDKMSYQTCLAFQAHSYKYDKQFIGYVKNGEKIIYINLIDFTEDPHHLKPVCFWQPSIFP